MGFYYSDGKQPQDEPERPGCLDVLIITRIVLGVLLWPIVALFGVVIGVALAFYLMTLHPALGLVPVGAGILVVYLLVQWDKRRAPPDELDDAR